MEDPPTSLSRLLLLLITSMRAAFVQLQNASVLPMHGFDPCEDMYTTTKEEGRYWARRSHVTKVPKVHNLVIDEHVRGIGNTCLYGQPAPEEFYSFHVTAWSIVQNAHAAII